MFTEYKQSWTMFRGNVHRTGTAKIKPLTKPLLYWTIELGPMISSPVFERGFLYNATLTGRIFCLDILRRNKMASEYGQHYRLISINYG